MSKTAREVIFDELTSSPSDVMDLADDIIHALNIAGFVIVPKEHADLLKHLAAMDPTAPSEIDGGSSCFFCGAHHPPEIDKHTDDCIWLNAKKIAEHPV